MSKRIKSLIVAGLLVVGMGFTKVDSFAAETSPIQVPQFEIGVKQEFLLENGAIKLTITEEEGKYYYIVTDWNSTKVKVTSVKTYFEDGTYVINETQFKDGDKCDTIIKDGEMYKVNLNNDQNQKLTKVEVIYDILDNAKEESNKETLSYVDSIVNKYKENMKSLGEVNGDFRYINKNHGISEEEWNKFVENFNKEDNGLEIKYNEDEKMYIVFELINNSIVERIQVDFVDVTNKGWIPEITPGTGQALAVGGLVIGAAAVTGLLVNNRKRKDEE